MAQKKVVRCPSDHDREVTEQLKVGDLVIFTYSHTGFTHIGFVFANTRKVIWMGTCHTGENNSFSARFWRGRGNQEFLKHDMLDVKVISLTEVLK
jgi:hypothetical protein